MTITIKDIRNGLEKTETLIDLLQNKSSYACGKDFSIGGSTALAILEVLNSHKQMIEEAHVEF